jgi:hypothetical protein
MPESTNTAKGQTTVLQPIRDAMQIQNWKPKDLEPDVRWGGHRPR